MDRHHMRVKGPVLGEGKLASRLPKIDGLKIGNRSRESVRGVFSRLVPWWFRTIVPERSRSGACMNAPPVH